MTTLPTTETDFTQPPPHQRPPHQPFHKEYFFLYGTLADPSTLSSTLGTSIPPSLQPASIKGWHYKLWGLYPALLEGPQTGVVRGVAYEAQSASERAKLIAHQGSHYTTTKCRMELEDGRVVDDVLTFKWNGAENVLRDGEFDLNAWEMRELMDTM
ncbi:hypothetical protein BDN72DRAFT_840372 [Pluteus cervinus]|uniref:Uncharacterized protein n=1 Tax=Pluteus cervinus TaxID=181527 RepID=A0ACD3AVM6_9AGAR|nr:hypothetical protein BDN72DRAFT_840372 [Pluteus cervinus]